MGQPVNYRADLKITGRSIFQPTSIPLTRSNRCSRWSQWRRPRGLQQLCLLLKLTTIISCPWIKPESREVLYIVHEHTSKNCTCTHILYSCTCMYMYVCVCTLQFPQILFNYIYMYAHAHLFLVDLVEHIYTCTVYIHVTVYTCSCIYMYASACEIQDPETAHGSRSLAYWHTV